MKITINRPPTQAKMRELKIWCLEEFGKSFSEFYPEFLPHPKTFEMMMRITCDTEEEAMMFLLKWKN